MNVNLLDSVSSDTTLCGEAKYDNLTAANGVIKCNRNTTAQYIHFVAGNTDANVRLHLFEMRAFSEKEIGRDVIQVTG